jgi:Predicted metal-binding integral membrane protein (DUF2182)
MTVVHPQRRGPSTRSLVTFGRRVIWPYPEAWPAALVICAWWLVVLWRPQSHSAGVAPHQHAASTGTNGLPPLIWWVVMVIAMMVPLTLLAARTVAFNSLWRRRHRAVAIFLLTYIMSWVAVAAVMALARRVGESWSGVAWHDAPVAVASALLGAAAWQLTPWKRRTLRASHRTMPLAPRGWHADRDCVRWGLVTARGCTGSCWPVMLIMTLTHHIGVMAALTGLSLIDRYSLRPRLAPGAAVLAGLAVVTLTGTAGP